MTALLTIIVLVFILIAIWQMVKIFDLAQANLAHALMESSVHIGKIMLKVGG